MPAAGDVVRCRRRSGRWLVMRREVGAMPSGHWYTLRSLEDPTRSLLAAEHALDVLGRARFEAGQAVEFNGESITVVADDGGHHVTVAFCRRFKTAGGQWAVLPKRIGDVGRADLAIENLGALHIQDQAA